MLASNSSLQEHSVGKVNSVAISPVFVKFILENIDGFDMTLEGEDRIVITPKPDARVHPASWKHFEAAISPSRKSTISVPLRPKFIYTVNNRDYTPEQAKAFGMSKPRLRVYELIYTAGAEGIGYKAIREKSGLPHGSVMQILHWLRKQKLITGEPE